MNRLHELAHQVGEWFSDHDNWVGPTGVPHLAVEHLELSALSLLVAIVVAFPLAVVLGHIGKGGAIVGQVANVGRAVPTLAVLIILLIAGPPFGFSRVSAVTAFALFAIPPIFTNVYVGIRSVSADVVEAARGMGMTGWQIATKVEIPAAVGMIVNGIQQAATQVIATVSIAAIATFGGLGRIVTLGYANQHTAQVVAGALIIAALALVTEVLFDVIRAVADPVRRAQRRVDKSR